MSFRVLRFSCVVVTIVFFASCEDKKNASEVKTEEAIVKSIDTIETKEVSEEKPAIKKYPKINTENAVDFFTAYGKENPETKVLLTTTHGEIEIRLFEDTPIHRANFIFLVKQHYFDDTFFHRIVPNFIIQGGNSDLFSTAKKRTALGGKYLLPAEIIPGRKHRKGTVSGAKEYRANPDNRTAPYEFFIFLGPRSSTAHLNDFYTIFGEVSKGMDVVYTIANLPADKGDWPMENVYIKAEVIE